MCACVCVCVCVCIASPPCVCARSREKERVAEGGVRRRGERKRVARMGGHADQTCEKLMKYLMILEKIRVSQRDKERP